MSRHHFVPLSIIREFASADAWRLVNATPKVQLKIAQNDLAVLQKKQEYSKWPICVYDKHSHRLERMLARDVCSIRNLYGVDQADDPLTRGIVKQLLTPASTGAFRPSGTDELIRQGREAIDADLIERHYIAKIDADFAKLIKRLKEGVTLSDDDRMTVFNFVKFARVRSPSYYRELIIVHANDIGQAEQNLTLLSQITPDTQQRIQIETAIPLLGSLLRHLTVQYTLRDETRFVDEWDVRICVLHTNTAFPFVLSDNLGRAYLHNSLKSIRTNRVPGLRDKGSRIVYPIAPSTCLLISTNPSYPVFSHVNVDAKFVKRLNTALALMADEQIILPAPHTSFFQTWLRLDNLRPIMFH